MPHPFHGTIPTALIHLPTVVPTVRRVGWVADFCPICHVVEVFEVHRHGNTIGHHGFALGKGWLFRFEVTCTGCGWTRVVDPDAYREILREPQGTVLQILAATNPDLPRREARALDLARALRRGPLEPEERRESVARVFDAAEMFSTTEKTAQEGALSETTRRCYLYLPVLLFLLSIPLLLSDWLPEGVAFPLLIALAVLPVGTGIVGWITYPYRFTRHVLRPLLVRGLRPLGATATEIADAARRRRWRDHEAALRGLAKEVAPTEPP